MKFEAQANVLTSTSKQKLIRMRKYVGIMTMAGMVYVIVFLSMSWY